MLDFPRWGVSPPPPHFDIVEIQLDAYCPKCGRKTIIKQREDSWELKTMECCFWCEWKSLPYYPGNVSPDSLREDAE